jgi:hypothetical protein
VLSAGVTGFVTRDEGARKTPSGDGCHSKAAGVKQRAMGVEPTTFSLEGSRIDSA